MCGISAIVGRDWVPAQLNAMVASQHHRGPDNKGTYIDSLSKVGLGHNRLSIIDLSPAGRQPMSNYDGSLQLVFNGEIYNYRELRSELGDYPYHSQTDSEVILAAYQQWGTKCLEHFIGMFAFVIWDVRRQRLFAARDRFGVKPLYYHLASSGTVFISSEIKALHAGGVAAETDATSWATYLTYGLYDHSERTFWSAVKSLPPGHALSYADGQLQTWCWYDLAERTGLELDARPENVVEEEYLSLLKENVRLRFRSDVPVGINLSGGLDSSVLLGLVQALEGPESQVKAFTYVTGDPLYDELPWVRTMLARTRHPSVVCSLRPEDVPALTSSVQFHEDEPFGGLPTLACARLFEEARREGVIVLLDGQSLDEQWAGYEYYQRHLLDTGSNGAAVLAPVQGSRDPSVLPDCLTPEFRANAEPFAEPSRFPDALRNRQYLDARYSKIPRALRFNDRVSMRASTELREPFLDHRLFELALRQPPERKLSAGIHKKLLRKIAKTLLPEGIVEAPKRPVQTPQREWLRGSLKEWADGYIQRALSEYGDTWLDRPKTQRLWEAYCGGMSDNSFYVWQWISLGLWRDCLLSR
jgi:asparagine synthase (glutamine-hydrolysing)